MKNKRFYRVEKFNFTLLIIFLILLGMTISFLYSNVLNNQTFDIKMFLPFSFFYLIILGIATYQIRANYIFNKNKKIILANGTTFEGNVTDTKSNRTDSSSSNSSTVKYFALIEFNNGVKDIKYWTPALSFNPSRLTSRKVKVHYYEDNIYVDGFEVGSIFTLFRF